MQRSEHPALSTGSDGVVALSPRDQAPEPPKRRTTQVALLVASLVALGVLLMLPNFLGLYWVRVLTTAFMFATLAQAINLIAGYTGYPAFGNVVFFGLGAYATAIAMVRFELPFVVGLLCAVALSLLVAVTIGPALLRLRGHYFAVGTLGLNEATRAVVDNLQITGGGWGLSIPLHPGGVHASASLFYTLFLFMAAGMLLLTWFIIRSPFGYACRAIRADEEAAASLGVATTRVKTLMWAISAMVTGLAGGTYAYWLSYIDPPSVFNMAIAIKFFVIMLLGGVGTLFGPVIGAIFLELVATATWTQLLDFHAGVLGLIVIGVVIFFPGGFVDFFRRRVSQVKTMFDPGRT
jgi:branched-chain amino acid transport system permease protein